MRLNDSVQAPQDIKGRILMMKFRSDSESTEREWNKNFLDALCLGINSDS